MVANRGVSTVVQAAQRVWYGILDLLYPHLCIGCGAGLADRTVVLCESCVASLPRTEHATHRDNRVEQMFADIPLAHSLVRGGAFAYYEYESLYREMIHAFKYRAQPQIGIHLARLAAIEFAAAGFFDEIDYLVPVPLHKKRLGRRTYNQSELICEGLQQVTNIAIDTTHLYRKVDNATQTQKSKEERIQNTQGIFVVRSKEDWRGKHIMLVDDVLTTGATMRACMEAMKGIRGLRVSVFALGVARTLNAEH